MMPTASTKSSTATTSPPPNLPTNQGKQAYVSPPDDEVYRQQQLANGSYYVPCTVSAEQIYQYTGNDITVTAPTVTAADGTALTAGTDFTYSPTTVNEAGTYNLVITGNGVYSGTKTIPIFVGSDVTSESLTTGEYTVNNDLTIDWRIDISGDVVVNIPTGVTLTAKKGFELSEDNTLTINGPGALVINDCDTGKSGIGAATMGTLVINGGKLTIAGGTGAAGIGYETVGGDLQSVGGDLQSPTGTLTLGWTYGRLHQLQQLRREQQLHVRQ